MTTEEGNKLIAEFMGYKKYSDRSQSYIINGGAVGEDKLLFHSSWDWLMPVVEKIDDLGYWVEMCHSFIGTKTRAEVIKWCEIGKENHTDLLKNDQYTRIARAEGSTRIESTWLAVVEFIKWYNNERKRTI